MTDQLIKYKLRAECQEDVETFVILIQERDPSFEWEESDGSDSEGSDLGDPEVVFSSSLSAAELNAIFDDVPDGHAMRETLNFEADYTGERTYQECSWLPVDKSHDVQP